MNDLVDAHDEREGENEWIKAKLADMEDRPRRNNLKIRGIPESVQQSDLSLYAATMFKSLLPSLTDLDVTIIRIHRLTKPSHLSDQIPRDVLLRLHFFHAKEHLMSIMRNRHKFITVPKLPRTQRGFLIPIWTATGTPTTWFSLGGFYQDQSGTFAIL